MVTKEEVLRCAKLSRLKFDDGKLEYMSAQLSRIMEMIDSLKEIDTEHAEPLTSVLKANLRMREDEVTVQNIEDKLFANVQGNDAEFAKEVKCFIVPKVVE